MTIRDLSSIGKVGVLFGGTTAEREVSLDSGRAIIAACEKLNLDVQGIDLQDNVIQNLQSANIDTAFIALHGGIGEDGRLQVLLDFMNIAYTGSGVQASVLAMNKLLSKQLWQSVGVATSPFEILTKSSNFKSIIDSLGSVMVKPAHEGSSIGMAIANNAEELKAAFLNAAKYDTSVFAEQLLPGAEYTIAILDGEVLPPIKLETSHVFYDYDAKYLADDTQYICPCGLPYETEEQLKQLAKKAFTSLGCEGWGRVDVMVDDRGQFNVLEVNTVPGMTSHSLVPMAAKAAGYDFNQLIEKILLTVPLAAG